MHLAMEATAMRDLGHIVKWDEPDYVGYADRIFTEPQGMPFLLLPPPDRLFTKAFDRKYQNNGNYKHHPGTYIQSAAGCWWGKCTFCKERGKQYVVRPVDDVINEIKQCKAQGFREIFDDAASFPTGEWREEFISKLRPLNVTFSCNMRFGTNPDYKAMKDAGFRMLLYGLESANQETLDKVNKGVWGDHSDLHIIEELVLASSCGLEPHVAVMFGYPWEAHEDSMRTLKLVHYLLRKGYAKTAQASVYMAAPEEHQPPCEKAKFYVPRIYHAAFYPDFWINKLKDIRNVDDIKYIWRGIKSCFGI